MPALASRRSAVLQNQPIDGSGPGTILADFETLLDFIGTSGIQTGGKNYRIPLKALGDLDARMTHPLRPALNRPQQLSYPHLNGLYLLVRTTGLAVSSGQGDSGRLSISPQRLEKWKALNHEERYFTLLQAMLTSDWGCIESGSRGGPWDELSWSIDHGVRRRRAPTKAGIPASEFFYNWTAQATAALLELFGILEIQRVAPRAGESWRIAEVRMTDLGKELLSRLRSPEGLSQVLGFRHGRAGSEDKWLADLFPEFSDCRNTLGEDEGTFVEGLWQFKVSLWKVWRRMVIPADCSVDELICGIINAFRFDFDHLYELTLRDRTGRNVSIGHEALEDPDYYTDEFAIGSLPTDPGQSMNLIYDFGDNWEFTIKLEKILPPNGRIKRVKVIAKQGEPPAQYPNADECW